MESSVPVRVIEFRSAKEYSAFRLQPAADAYFLGGDTADYIVMPGSSQNEFQTAAHEYAHLVLHSLGLKLPPWLSEGMAEMYSSVHISSASSLIGTGLPTRTRTLREGALIPLRQLLASAGNTPGGMSRKEAEMFYAESWALTHMLFFSTGYTEHLKQLWSAMAAGTLDADALARIYGKPISAIAADLQAWVEEPKPGVPLEGVSAVAANIQVSTLADLDSRVPIAGLLLACGDLDRAEQAYAELAKERPNDPGIPAALGTIALRKKNPFAAREQWKRAMQLGVTDASLCYRYAILAEDAGLPNREITAALRRAIELRPDFDDARYRLQLLERNSGNYDAAIVQLRAMRSIPTGRAYAYWMALASALAETDRRTEARQAAYKAASFAKSTEERISALQLAYIADTDLTVQLSRDSSGNLQIVTARKPHGSEDWNPFIQPGDDIRSLTGTIRKVECSAGKITGFRIGSASAMVEVALPDPTQVMIAGGSAAFVCDAEDGRRVAIQYAASEKLTPADGILRGMQFQ